jgi:predicted DsbA family dithiol-disulfide isomerase
LLNDEKTKELVEKNLKLARDWGITGVPSLVIDEKYLISGALKKEYLKKQLLKIANEEML